jgi:hypothetical protein
VAGGKNLVNQHSNFGVRPKTANQPRMTRITQMNTSIPFVLIRAIREIVVGNVSACLGFGSRPVRENETASARVWRARLNKV